MLNASACNLSSRTTTGKLYSTGKLADNIDRSEFGAFRSNFSSSLAIVVAVVAAVKRKPS